jgi:flagellar M-ring protein FliF
MADLFKQLFVQINELWSRLSLTQKIITGAIGLLSLVGFILLIAWSTHSGGKGESGMVTLFSNLEMEEGGQIVEKLKEGKYAFSLENEGRRILVPQKSVYELRLMFAKQGLPKAGGLGYEIFDKTNLGMTDFVQKLNFKRALEGELTRTIESMDEVTQARVHIVIPKETIFTQEKQPPKASVVLKLKAVKRLTNAQVDGIVNLVASAVDGLQARHISIIDINGNILNNPFGEDEVAERTSRQLELQHSVEKRLREKVETLLGNILGPDRATVSISTELDFDQIEKTLEQYNPESRVVRSEERKENQGVGSPNGNEKNEHSITNYEIDKTVQHVIEGVGAIKRLWVSVALDGSYKSLGGGKKEYTERSPAEMARLEDLVKQAASFDPARNDQITVVNVQFASNFFEDEKNEMESIEKNLVRERWIKIGIVGLLIIAFFIFLNILLGHVVDALNPAVPDMLRIGEKEELPEEPPETAKRVNELLEKVEIMTRDEPVHVAALIRTWLMEVPTDPKKGK